MRQITDIWFIGDSHVSAFAEDGGMIGEYPLVAVSPFNGVKVCRVGPQLAGTLHKSASSTGGRRKAFKLAEQISPSSTVFFSFGEIDCRAHIVRRAKFKSELIEECVNESVKCYFNFLLDFRDHVAGRNIQLGVLSPPPTTSLLHPANGHFALKSLTLLSQSNAGRNALRIIRNFFVKRSQIRQAIGLTLNHSGTDSQIIMASRLFSEKLRKKCSENEFHFVDMRSNFATDAGQPDPKWFWDAVHLKQSAVLAMSKDFEKLGIRNFSGPEVCAVCRV